MINSVRCAELGEACLAPTRCQYVVIQKKQALQATRPKTYNQKNAQCAFCGRIRFRPYEMVFNILCVL